MQLLDSSTTLSNLVLVYIIRLMSQAHLIKYKNWRFKKY